MRTDRNLALVTGAAGLVGDRVAKGLLQEGLFVRALDQRPVNLAGADSCQADVTDPVAVQRAAAGPRWSCTAPRSSPGLRRRCCG